MMVRLLPAFLLLIGSPAWAARADRAPLADELFQMDRLLTIHIQLSAEHWQMMQPGRASRIATAMAVVQHPTTQQAIQIADRKPPKNDREEGARRAPGLVGNEYAYVSAEVTIDGQTIERVGVRFKGQWSYTLAGSSPRRPMKLDFNRFVSGQHFRGVHSLSLNTNALDPSQLRESVGYAFFRDAGVPAPRTCLAVVYLTVKGTYDHELLGLYTVVEEINKDFLQRHFGTDKGLLIRPERTRNLAHFGENWEDYGRYNLQSKATPLTARRFIDFTRTIHLASDETFCSEIPALLETDLFLRFIAANVMMVNLDGVLVNGHNFYVYVHPQTGRLTFIPWDLHLGFGWNGNSLDEWVSLTIDRPFRDGNRLLERMMTVGWMREMYREYLREFATGCFAPQRMHARIEMLEEVVRKAEAIAAREGKKLPVSMPTGAARPRAELKPFVSGRVESVLGQLAGRVEGDPIGGRPRKPVPPPAPKRAPAPAPPKVVAKVPEVKKTDKPVEARQISKKDRPRDPAGNPIKTLAAALKPAPKTPPAPKPVPPPPLNPSPSLLVNMIDVNRDSQLSRDELIDAAKHLFIAHRWKNRGVLDELALAQALDRIVEMLNPYPISKDDSAPAEDPDRSRPALTWAGIILQQANLSQRQPASIHDLISATERMFQSADSNHDGLLNVREITACMQELSAATRTP